MFTYRALLISYVYTVFYTSYGILVYATLTLLVHIQWGEQVFDTLQI
jgi:hypothetical protein